MTLQLPSPARLFFNGCTFVMAHFARIALSSSPVLSYRNEIGSMRSGMDQLARLGAGPNAKLFRFSRFFSLTSSGSPED